MVLDGAGTLGEGITIRACTGVTIADLTVRNIRWNGIKLDSETGVQRATVRNCILHNIWQRAIKGVKVPGRTVKSFDLATAGSNTACSPTIVPSDSKTIPRIHRTISRETTLAAST